MVDFIIYGEKLTIIDSVANSAHIPNTTNPIKKVVTLNSLIPPNNCINPNKLIQILNGYTYFSYNSLTTIN